MVYADSGMQQKYGDWHGKKCHEYYCNLPHACDDCLRPATNDDQRLSFQDIDDENVTTLKDPHAKVHYVANANVRMIGVPFYDAGGRWLYARMHLPLQEFAESGSGEKFAASMDGI